MVVKITSCQPGVVKVYVVVGVVLVTVSDPPEARGSKNTHVHSVEFDELSDPSKGVGVFKHTVTGLKSACIAGAIKISSSLGSDTQPLPSITVRVIVYVVDGLKYIFHASPFPNPPSIGFPPVVLFH